jgi:peptidyl-prolyl cis-trans isomerase SurA
MMATFQPVFRCRMFRFTLMLAFVCLFGQAVLAVPQKIGIAVVVNQDIITHGDIAARASLFINTMNKAPTPDMRAQIERQVVERLIEERIKMQEAKALGIQITDQQVADGIASLAQQNNSSPELFRQQLRGAGIKPSTLEDQIRADIAWSMVVRRKLRPQINVTDTEVESEIASMTRGPGRKEFLTAELFLKVPTPAQDVDVLRKIEEMRAAIASGKPFQVFARQFSEAPGAATGGDLGWIEEGQLEPALNDALVAMNPGQLSQPVRGENGYHLLFLRDMRQRGGASEDVAAAATPAPAAPVTAATTAAIARARIKQIILPTFEGDPQVVTNAKISRAQSLKDEIKSCDGMDARMKDFTGGGTGDLGVVDIKTLPAELQPAAESLPDGILSAPAVLKTGIAVIMVCGRDNVNAVAAAPAAATPIASAVSGGDKQPTRDEIYNKIGMQRLEQLQSRYLNDLKSAAVVERRI